MARDVLLAEVPTVLRSEFYEVAALAGAAVVVVGYMLKQPATSVIVAGAAVCFGLRLVAIRRGWQLPIAGGHAPSTEPDPREVSR